MINYEEELKKFQPCLDVDDAEGAIYKQDIVYIQTRLKEMMRDNHKTSEK